MGGETPQPRRFSYEAWEMPEVQVAILVARTVGQGGEEEAGD